MSKKKTISEVKEKLKLVHGDKVIIDESTYVSSGAKARFIDSEFGEWWASVRRVCKGRRHTKNKCVNFKKSRQKSHDDFVARLKLIHGDTIKVIGTYENSHKKLLVSDEKYGTWYTIPGVLLRGHKHPERGRLAGIKKMKFTTVIKHWLTGEELACVGSYEKAFVEWCNKNQIDFDWQIKHLMPCGKTYIIDAYVKSGQLIDTWIEIKGTWARSNGPVGKEKWEWFASEHKNSLLLFKEDLVELGIL